MRRATRDCVNGCGETKLMHHPICFASFPGASKVINECLLKTDHSFIRSIRIDRFVYTCGFPKTGTSHSVRSYAVSVFPSSLAKEVVFLLCIPRPFKSTLHLIISLL